MYTFNLDSTPGVEGTYSFPKKKYAYVMKQKVIKAGNSTAVTVPAKFVRQVGVHVGDITNVTINPEKGQVVYTFSGVRQLRLPKTPKKP